MKTLRALSAAVLLVAIGVLLGAGLSRAHAAKATAAHHYTLYVGDKVSIPGLGQTCALEEPNRLNFLCSRRTRTVRHSVQIFRNIILVYKAVPGGAVAVWQGAP
jgi:hypothetical protein